VLRTTYPYLYNNLTWVLGENWFSRDTNSWPHTWNKKEVLANWTTEAGLVTYFQCRFILTYISVVFAISYKLKLWVHVVCVVERRRNRVRSRWGGPSTWRLRMNREAQNRRWAAARVNSTCLAQLRCSPFSNLSVPGLIHCSNIPRGALFCEGCWLGIAPKCVPVSLYSFVVWFVLLSDLLLSDFFILWPCINISCIKILSGSFKEFFRCLLMIYSA